MDMYKGDGTFDAIKAAAYAAGRAHQDAQRRGSQINLVDSHNNKTTSLLFRRPSSEQRELEQAREKFKTTREMYFGGVDKKWNNKLKMQEVRKLYMYVHSCTVKLPG